MYSLKSIGLLSDSTPISVDSWASLPHKALATQLGTPVPVDPASLVSALTDALPLSRIEPTLEALAWLTDPSAGLPPVPTTPTLPIYLLTILLSHRLRYAPDERDLVILSHEIVTEDPALGPSGTEVHTSSLIAYGSADASAMSRCVGLPVALAALHVLDGRVAMRGVGGPTDRGVYESVLGGLERLGLGMKEVSRKQMQGMEGTLAAGLRSMIDQGST